MPARYRKYLEFGALLLVAAGIVWWFGRKLDWNKVKAALASSDWRLILLAGVVILGGYFWRAVRWRAFLAPITEASLREIWIATTVGYGAVLLIGRAGEVVRPVVLPMRDKRVRPAASFVTIFVERVYDSITVMLLFAVSLVWFTPSAVAASEFARARQLGFALAGALLVAILVLIWFRARSQSVIGWVDRRFTMRSKVGGRIKHGLLNLLAQLATALRVLANRRELAVTVGWSLMLWGSVAAGNLIVFRAFGLSLGISHALFVLGWSMIGSAIPTPGGAAGAFHAVTGAALVLLGVARDQAAAVAIILHLVDFAPAALFGFFYFLRGDINVKRLRSLMSSDVKEQAMEDEILKATARQKHLDVAAVNK
jgi:glycosyltransferase 2 family protein